MQFSLPLFPKFQLHLFRANIQIQPLPCISLNSEILSPETLNLFKVTPWDKYIINVFRLLTVISKMTVKFSLLLIIAELKFSRIVEN